MIEVCVRNMANEEIGYVWVRELPRLGDHLRLRSGGAFNDGYDQYRVSAVVHNLDPLWSPDKYDGQPPHSIVLYVEPWA